MRRWSLLSRRHGRKLPVPSLGERHVRDRTRDTKILDGATFYRHSMTVLGTPICDAQWAHICALLDITYEIEKQSVWGLQHPHNQQKNQIKNKKLLIDIHSRGPPLYMGTSVLLLCELHFTSISCITFTALLDSHISFDHWYGLFRRRHEDILRIRDDL